jgi:GTPase SAR1 family protein
MLAPKIQPIQLKEYNCKQSKYNDVVPKLPMRSMLVGPSGGGKTVLLTNMILDIYRDCFSRVYIWSPSINVDSTWKPVKDYIRDHIKPNDREKCYFDSYEPSELEQVIKTQQKVIDYQKEQKHKDLYQILIVIDDFADDTNFTRKSTLLHQLYIRGRHYMISTITSTQVYKQISPIVRKNMTHLFIYRLRNYGDLESIVEELSAIYDKKTLLQIYHEAVSEDYSFLYVNLMQKDKSKMFMIRFDHYLNPS